jgi:hypothetical protein
MNRLRRAAALLLMTAPWAFAWVAITPETRKAFDRYAALTEARMSQETGPGQFLWMDGRPEERKKAREGRIVIAPRKTLDNGREIDPPNGDIQHWLGAAFFPQATMARVRAVMQDYENYKIAYRPDVIESKLLNHRGDDFDIFLRLYKRQFLIVVLNSEYHVHYSSPDPRRMSVVSHSTRIAEVKDAKRSVDDEEPVGNDNGYLWALNSYWRFEEKEGGVYAECEAISLSRDTPFGLGFLVKAFLEKFPKESMRNTMEATAKAVGARLR